MDLGLRDRVYLVTGGSRGLGFAAAQALVSEGTHVVLSSRNEASVAAAATRLAGSSTATGSATWIAADNGEPAAAARLGEAAQERFGRSGGALDSVGATSSGIDLDTTDDAWRSRFEEASSVPLVPARRVRIRADLSRARCSERDGPAAASPAGDPVTAGTTPTSGRQQEHVPAGCRPGVTLTAMSPATGTPSLNGGRPLPPDRRLAVQHRQGQRARTPLPLVWRSP